MVSQTAFEQPADSLDSHKPPTEHKQHIVFDSTYCCMVTIYKHCYTHVANTLTDACWYANNTVTVCVYFSCGWHRYCCVDLACYPNS